MLGFKLIAGALASLAFVGVAIGAGLNNLIIIKPSSTGSLVMEPFISMVRYLVYPGLVANH